MLDKKYQNMCFY